METKARGPFSNNMLIQFLVLYIQFVHSRAFQGNGLLHRLDWEQKGRDGSGIEEAQNAILGTLE